MKVLWVDGEEKCISTKLKKFCEKQEINIKYIIFYLYKENDFVKCGEKIFIIMKNSLFINNSLFNNFWVKVMETFNYLDNRLPIRSKSYRKLILKET